jgi:hypothetical protein
MAGDETALIPPRQSTDRGAWWREARFGMFIHWGLYSIIRIAEAGRYQLTLKADQINPDASQGFTLAGLCLVPERRVAE